MWTRLVESHVGVQNCNRSYQLIRRPAHCDSRHAGVEPGSARRPAVANGTASPNLSPGAVSIHRRSPTSGSLPVGPDKISFCPNSLIICPPRNRQSALIRYELAISPRRAIVNPTIGAARPLVPANSFILQAGNLRRVLPPMITEYSSWRSPGISGQRISRPSIRTGNSGPPSHSPLATNTSPPRATCPSTDTRLGCGRELPTSLPSTRASRTCDDIAPAKSSRCKFTAAEIDRGCRMIVTANSVSASATSTIAAPGARSTCSASPGTAIKSSRLPAERGATRTVGGAAASSAETYRRTDRPAATQTTSTLATGCPR